MKLSKTVAQDLCILAFVAVMQTWQDSAVSVVEV